jgi:hypothetical protein
VEKGTGETGFARVVHLLANVRPLKSTDQRLGIDPHYLSTRTVGTVGFSCSLVTGFAAADPSTLNTTAALALSPLRTTPRDKIPVCTALHFAALFSRPPGPLLLSSPSSSSSPSAPAPAPAPATPRRPVVYLQAQWHPPITLQSHRHRIPFSIDQSRSPKEISTAARLSGGSTARK